MSETPLPPVWRDASMLQPRVLGPFVLVGLIWGSTWWVITGQIDGVPASWSVTYRFALACPAMFVVARLMGRGLNIGRDGHILAAALGLFQFAANFGFVYRAEHHLTSGIVAVMFGLLMVPNAILGRVLLGQRVSAGFVLGSAIAGVGIAALLVHEARLARLSGDIALGTALTIGGILAASIANVIQAGKVGRKIAMPSLIAWAMFYGVIIDALIAFASAGPPVIPRDPQFWAGTAWLALAGSVVTFPLYYQIVREIGPGRAAYNGVLVIVVAMAISTLAEGYRWSPLAAFGALAALLGMVIALRTRAL